MAQAKPSFLQDLAWRLEALGFDLVTGLARAFPIDLVSDFGAWLFQRLGPLTGAHRVAETNLRIAFPDASDAEIARLLKEQWNDHATKLVSTVIVTRRQEERCLVCVVRSHSVRPCNPKREAR